MRRLGLPMVLLLAACASPLQWVKDGGAPDQADKDLSQCHSEAFREVQYRELLYGVPPSMSDPIGTNQQLEENRLAQECMRKKGYRLVSVKPGAK